MFHVYTYGRGSRQFMILTRSQAEIVNLFTHAFMNAQEMFLKLNGRRWTPGEPIGIDDALISRKQMRRYNRIAGFLNKQHKIRNFVFGVLRIDVSHEELDDYLTERF